jgi:four helix bundle protein
MLDGSELGLGNAQSEALPTKRPAIHSYEDLEVYQRSFKLLRPIHELAKRFPAYEQYDLAQQMRRASKSVPANIAEGYSRRQSARDFKLYLAHAQGSSNEMVVHLKIAVELSYASKQETEELIASYDIIGRQLNRLIGTWRRFDGPNPNLQLPASTARQLQNPTSNL